MILPKAACRGMGTSEKYRAALISLFSFSSPRSLPSLILCVLTSPPLLRPRLPVGKVKYWKGSQQSNATNLAVNPMPTTGVTSGLPQQGSGFPFFFCTYSSAGKKGAWDGRCVCYMNKGRRDGGRLTLYFLCSG